MFSERSGVVNIGLEGMMLAGCFFGILGADKLNSWELGIVMAAISGAVLGLIHAFFAIHMRADQIVGGTAINFLALGVTGYFYIQIYGLNGTPGTGVPYIPDVKLSFLDHIPPHSYGEHSFWYNALGHLNLMTWLLFAARGGVVLLHVPHVDRASSAVGRGASAGGGDRRHRRLQGPVRRRHHLGDDRVARGRVPRGRLRALVHREHDGGPRLHRAGRAHRRRLAARRAPSGSRCCSASSAGSPSGSRATATSRRCWCRRCPTSSC